MFQFESLAEFMTMDGHGIYVWCSYFVSLVLMGGLLLSPIINRRRLFQQVEKQQQREIIRQQPSESNQ